LASFSIPPGISGSLHDLALGYMLTKACDYGIKLIEVVQAVSQGNARYVGVRLEPGDSSRVGVKEVGGV